MESNGTVAESNVSFAGHTFSFVHWEKGIFSV